MSAGGKRMTNTLTPQTESLLRQKAEREGADLDTVAESLLAMVLQWEAEEQASLSEGIQRGLQDADAGRTRPFADFAAEMRAKYHLPA